MKAKKSNKYKREQLPDKSHILLNPSSFFISKQEITLKYTEAIRNDIKALMKEKSIGWTELSRLLKGCGCKYNPNAIQNYVNGSTFSIKDISYFVPIVILLNALNN
jgi:hypothetical protein